ncbi:hypothetical protein PAPYR_4584 [Paratrimastix pyriformis]|uniref:Uncharacterized protein n=1 Tax=Paratrimastix pyriformis TaxID=342808 RepID=A0ABQ8UJX5_9EUKA|nr:hypothetical protein PAPYR_4584 [Paratrimastix pyriformis]
MLDLPSPPKRILSLASMISEPHAPYVASLCRIHIPGMILHPTVEVFPKRVFLLLEVVPLGVFLLRVRPPPSQCRPGMPLEVVPDGGAGVAQRCPLRLSPTAGFSSFLRLSPTAGFPPAVFLLLEVVPYGGFSSYTVRGNDP